jgi:CheY-like chemotaxis protein
MSMQSVRSHAPAASVLVCSDDAELRSELHRALDLDDRFLPECAAIDLAAGLARMMDPDRPDLVLLDRRLPGLEDGPVLQRLADAVPPAGIVLHPGRPSATATGASVPVSFVDAIAGAVAAKASHATRYPGTPTPSAARRFAAEVCERWGVGSIVDSVQLVASELVTNATHHGSEPVGLRIDVTSATVFLEVRDANSSAPTLRGSDLDALSGRGLNLVSAFAIVWGIRPSIGGKAVWAVLGHGAAAA